jgi:hypothetical protein
MNVYLGQVQNLDWASPSRFFATTVDLFNAQPNYEHELAIVFDTGIKYQGVAPVVGGWGFATGAPGPYPLPPDPPVVNDRFTQLLLEFEGLEGSRTYLDTNAVGIPRKWTQLTGNGRISNVGAAFDTGSLFLDGQTVITAPDAPVTGLRNVNFTIRLYFRCDFPLGTRRTLVAKTDDARVNDVDSVFWVDRLADGRMNVGVGTIAVGDISILDRSATQIVDRGGEFVVGRIVSVSGESAANLQSVTLYSDTLNPGWHELKFIRRGQGLELLLDGITEDTEPLAFDYIRALPGPLTIGGYGIPRDGVFVGNPWIGGLDRFAVDVGIAR